MKQHIMIFAAILVLSSCGRKSRDIFDFNKDQGPIRPSKLSFPAPRSIQASTAGQTITITWSEITPHAPHSLIGYNVYQFYEKSFIGHKPCNKKPLQAPSFTYKKKIGKPAPYFIVRAVFKLTDGSTMEGPASKVVGEKL